MSWTDKNTEPFRKYNFTAKVADADGRELIEQFQVQKFEKQAWNTFVITYVPLYKNGDILFMLENNIGNLFDIAYSLYDGNNLKVSERTYKTCLVDYEVCSEYGESDSVLNIKLYFDGSKELNEPIAAAEIDYLGI